MTKKSIFDNISEYEKQSMMTCFGAKHKKYKPEDVVADYNRGTDKIGILQSGKANLERVDINGNRTILETLEKGDIFGQAIAFGRTAGDSLCVICEEDCMVMYIDYKSIVNTCSNACAHHCMLIRNLFEIMALKVSSLSERVEILSHRSIRDKILCCFKIAASRQNTQTFDLPFNTLASMADYICADRSAMMREIRHMKEAGLIKITGKRVTLLKEKDE